MKKYAFAVLALAALVAFSSPLFAEDGKMMFGVKAGLNMANLIGDDKPDDSSMRMGIAGGVFMCYKFTDIFAIQPELLYVQKGMKYTGEDDAEYTWKTDYFEIPVLLKVNLPTEGKIKPSLYAGPAIGILMTAKDEDEDVKDYLKSMDWGILAGVGLGYQMEKGLLFGEFRYEVGLSTIWDLSDEELEGADQPDSKHSDMSILVGYGFAF